MTITLHGQMAIIALHILVKKLLYLITVISR